MKKALFFLAVLFTALSVRAEEPKAKSKPEITVPGNLDECFVELQKKLDKPTLEKMKKGPEQDMVLYHHGLGTWIRNNWGLWSGSKLRDWFTSRGVRHPDDMSSIILRSFWRHLHGKPLEVEKQAKAHRRYWAVRKMPPAWKCPKSKEPIAVKYGLRGTKEDALTARYLRVGYCKQEKEFYVYEPGKGWHKPEKSVLKRIKQLEKKGTHRLVEAPLQESSTTGRTTKDRKEIKRTPPPE